MTVPVSLRVNVELLCHVSVDGDCRVVTTRQVGQVSCCVRCVHQEKRFDTRLWTLVDNWPGRIRWSRGPQSPEKRSSPLENAHHALF